MWASDDPGLQDRGRSGKPACDAYPNAGDVIHYKIIDCSPTEVAQHLTVEATLQWRLISAMLIPALNPNNSYVKLIFIATGLPHV